MRVEGLASSGGNMANQPSSLLMAAHELKEPLALIRQLSLELQTELDSDVRNRLHAQIEQTAERSLRLTTGLTKASSLQPSLFPTEAVNVNRVFADVRQEMQPLFRLHGRSVSHKLHLRRSLKVVANYDLLRRVILGFADNALHYANADGRVELFAEKITSRDVVRLGVRDYGPMLSTALWRQLNQSASLHNRPDASGLGLVIADAFASHMHGSIGATRHRDGASFYVELPQSRQLSLL